MTSTLALLGVAFLVFAVSATYLTGTSSALESIAAVLAWTVAQCIPVPDVANQLQSFAWDHWESEYSFQRTFSEEPLVKINVQDFDLPEILPYLESTFGTNWRRRPVLFQGLWTSTDLKNPNRRLSLHGLLQENMTIPYFIDARSKNGLIPDGKAAVRDIVGNISNHGSPHKIASQFVVQTYPELVDEVAPRRLITDLFGDHFSADAIKGSGPFNLLPGATTVPLFVANGKSNVHSSGDNEDQPFTALHCEPIGNVAVQLSGRKRWTLVPPEFSFVLRPSASPDNRAYFASYLDPSDYDRVPHYSVITEPGDALWVPTWTWHRVDYLHSDDIAIAASLFHFRPIDFWRDNPFFAVLLIPAFLLEIVGANTQ